MIIVIPDVLTEDIGDTEDINFLPSFMSFIRCCISYVYSIVFFIKVKKNLLESVGMASGSMQTVECCHGPERIPTDHRQ